jgi:hypothetical protein
MRVLVDTPIWSLALRRKQEVLSADQLRLVAELSDLIEEGRVCLIGPIRQEVLSGIRNEAAFEFVRERLAGFDDEPLAAADYEEAGRLFNVLRARGIVGSPTDLLLCAVATRRRYPLFTADTDFSRYVCHSPLQLYLARRRR